MSNDELEEDSYIKISEIIIKISYIRLVLG